VKIKQRFMAVDLGPFSLYIHIPYCAVKCPYCDFNVRVARTIPEPEYSGALIKELGYYAETDGWRGRELKSLFFGGGTPSLFSPESIAGIINRAARLFPFVPDIEITLEANPENRAHFKGYRDAGVNRLSLGAQTFQPELLRYLGRVHSPDDTRIALQTTQKSFDNFSLDLIYAIPGESLADLQADLAEALEFSPPHLSAYSLTIEEKTEFAYRLRTGKMTLAPEAEEIAMAETIEETLAAAELKRYEISNYARFGLQSKHNTAYWEGGDYLGIGAGAHSYLRLDGGAVFGRRWREEKNPILYMDRVAGEGTAAMELENLDAAKAAGEFMFMGLRTMRGVSTGDFSRRFGREVSEVYPKIGAWVEAGLMEAENGRLRLGRRGLMVADEIFLAFV
jgi:putative oxygen-independent coproporphyrinogen III oxidase